MTDPEVPEQMLLPLRTSAGFEMAAVEVTMSDPVRITVSPPGGERVVGQGHDVISALRRVRLQLQDREALLWVNGARRNVHASGMQRDMARGRFAYVLPPERGPGRPLSADVLEAPPPDADVVSVADQDAWYEAWLRAPGKSGEQAPASGAGSTTGAPRSARRRPGPDAVEAARSQPGGWVYEIEGDYAPTDAVPPEAVRGAWRVDDQGVIVDDFTPNPRFAEPGSPARGDSKES